MRVDRKLQIGAAGGIRVALAITLLAWMAPVGLAATVTSVLNAASYQGGGVAPGEIIVIFGAGIGPPSLAGLQLDGNGRAATQIGNTRVLFDGVPAPIVYALDGQTSVIVPYAVAGRGLTQMVVEYQGRSSEVLTLPVKESLPGLFSANATGTGPGAILNQNFSINSPQNPAGKGSVVVLFGTGEGSTTPTGQDGMVAASVFPAPQLPVTVTIGGVPQRVLYAGAAPGMVAGVMQINVEVSAATPSGNQPIVATIGTANSQSGLTIAIAAGEASNKITPAGISAWPNERTIDHPPLDAIDGNLNTFTWTASPNNGAAPSYIGLDLGPAKPVNRIRLFKEPDGGGGAQSQDVKDLTIEYTTSDSSIPLAFRTWTRVSGLTNGFGGAELLSAADVNSNGTVTRDSHSSAGSGWASLTFTSVSATGVRIGFSNPPGGPAGLNFYKVHEFEAFGGPGNGSPAIDLTPAALDFGAVTSGHPKELPVVVRNTGSANLVVNSVTSSNPRFALAVATPFTVSPGSSVSATIRFSPFSPGAQSATLTFASNDPAQPSRTISVLGAGDGSVAAPVLVLAPTSLDFGSVTTGQTRDLIVFVHNSGGTTLTVNSISSANPRFVLAVTTAPFSIEPGSTLSAIVRFSPTLPGGQFGTVTFHSNDPANPSQSITVSGTGTGPSQAPAIDLSPPSLDFGKIAAGQSKDLAIAVRNTGNTTLAVNAITSSNLRFALVNTATPFYLGPGSTQNAVIRFAPTAPGLQSGAITFLSDDPANPSRTINVVGTGTEAAQVPVISITPATLNFGLVETTEPKELIAVVRNTGNAVLTVESVTSSNPRFSLTSPSTPFTVEPGSIHNVTIRFAPATAGAQSGTITFTSNDPANAARTVNVSGFGTGETQGPVIGFTPASLEFGTVPVNQTKDLVVSVHNTGNETLTVNSISSSNARFVLTAPTVPFSVKPGSAQDVTVRFAPTAAGAQTGTITFASNDPASPSRTVSVTGTGSAEIQGPVIELSPASLAFGVVIQGQTKDMVIVVRNNGTAPLTVASITSSNAIFAATTAAPFNVAAGATSNVTVRFAPTAAGAQSGTITLASNDPATPSATVNVSGTGASETQGPIIDLSPASLDFGSVTQGQTKDLTLAVHNAGNAALTVNSITSSNAQFTIVTPATPFTVAAGSTQNVTIRFSPTGTGAQSGSLTVASNDSASPSVNVPLSGTGTASGGGTPDGQIPITVGQTVTGTLTTSSLPSVGCPNCYADFYRLTVTATQTVEIRLNSPVYDAYLQVLDTAKNILAADDNSGGGTNARLVRTFAPGTYLIEATTAFQGATGAYSLALTESQ